MEDYAIILNVDKALASLIWNSLRDDPNTQALLSNEKQISFASPKKCEVDSSKMVSIYLYDITEDLSVRRPFSANLLEEQGMQRRFTLKYIITPCTGNDEKDHLLLGKIIQIIANYPILVESEKSENSENAKRLDLASVTDPINLWNALGTPLKPCVCCTVSPVVIICRAGIQEKTKNTKSTQASLSINRTFDLYQIVLKTFTEQLDDWKKRNMLQKQWIFQDFKKNTNMSPEEMATILNSLGDKLELRLPASQLIRPLNVLAGFYEHQREEVKGLEKFSKKHRGTSELISKWISEVKALSEALSTNENAP